MKKLLLISALLLFASNGWAECIVYKNYTDCGEWKNGKWISDSQTSAKNQTSKSSNNPAKDGTVRLKCDCYKKVSRGITFRCKEKDFNKIVEIDRKKSTLSFDGDRLKITKTTKDYYFAKEGSGIYDTKIEINRDTLILEKKIFIDYTMFQCEVIERI